MSRMSDRVGRLFAGQAARNQRHHRASPAPARSTPTIPIPRPREVGTIYPMLTPTDILYMQADHNIWDLSPLEWGWFRTPKGKTVQVSEITVGADMWEAHTTTQTGSCLIIVFPAPDQSTSDIVRARTLLNNPADREIHHRRRRVSA